MHTIYLTVFKNKIFDIGFNIQKSFFSNIGIRLENFTIETPLLNSYRHNQIPVFHFCILSRLIIIVGV